MFSYDVFTAQATGGISRCMIELMRALADTPTQWQLWVGRHGNALLTDVTADGGLASHVLSAEAGTPIGRLTGSIRNERSFVKATRAVDATILHRTFYPVIDLVPARTLKRVETLHDMWDERAGENADRLTWLKSLLKRRALHAADAIVCVSESSRCEMIAIWPELAARAVVIPHGVRRLSERPTLAGHPRPFFLFVGRRNTYKNFTIALSALALAEMPDFDLICFGGGAFDAAENAAIQAAGLAERVIHTAGNDDRLAGMYEAATALLYPSAYEGFGLPLLEAMIHDCPVIAAPLTSLPEAGGDAALYADPGDVSAWATQMARIARDDAFSASLRARGRSHCAAFSWSRTAQRHAALYAELGN